MPKRVAIEFTLNGKLHVQYDDKYGPHRKVEGSIAHWVNLHKGKFTNFVYEPVGISNPTNMFIKFVVSMKVGNEETSVVNVIEGEFKSKELQEKLSTMLKDFT